MTVFLKSLVETVGDLNDLVGTYLICGGKDVLGLFVTKSCMIFLS